MIDVLKPVPPFHSRTGTFRGCLIAAGMIGILAGCGDTQPKNEESAGQELPTITVPVFEVRQQAWPQIVRSQGSLMADEVAVVGSRVEGRVAEVHVEIGDEVKTGTPLVTLNQSEFRLLVAQAEAQLQQARSAVGLRPGDDVAGLDAENAPPVREQKAVWNEALASLERAEQLQQRNSITAGEYEQIVAAAAVAEARYRSAVNSVQEKIALIGVRQAELELAEEDLANTVVVAPFDGFVQQKQASPGTYIRVGDSLATVVRTSLLRFRGTIPERYALALQEGQQVRLQVESVAQPLTVTVTRVSPSLDLLSRSLLYEAEVENAGGMLRTGLFAEAEVVVDSSATAIVIPPSALSEFAGAEKVWKVTAGESHEQEVLTGDRRPEGIEILQGLAEGDVILLNSTEGLLAKVIPSVQAATILTRQSGDGGSEAAN